MEYSEGMLLRHYFNYNSVLKGNNLSASIQYGDGNPNGLRSRVYLYHKHNVNFSKDMSDSNRSEVYSEPNDGSQSETIQPDILEILEGQKSHGFFTNAHE